MDFLPVNNSTNQRLQYTESFLMPNQINLNSLPVENEHQANLQNSNNVNIPHNREINQAEKQPVVSEKDLYLIKVHQDIDDYISRRSTKNINKSSINQSSAVNSHQEARPSLIQSHTSNIRLTRPNDLPHSIRGQSDGQEIIPLSSSRNTLQVGQTVEIPSHGHIQQSSVNINLHNNNNLNYQPVSHIYLQENASQQLDNTNSKRRSKIFRQTIKQQHIIPHEEIIVHQSNAQNSFNIEIPAQQSHFEENVREDILPKQTNEQVVIHTQPQEDYLIQNERQYLKRSIQAKQPLPLSFTLNQEQAQFLEEKDKSNLGRTLVVSQIQPIKVVLHQQDLLHESFNPPSNISQRRNLIQSKIPQSQLISISPLIEQHSHQRESKILLSRSLQKKSQPQPIDIELQSVKSYHIQQRRPPANLKRNLRQQSQEHVVQHISEILQYKQIEDNKPLDQSIHLSQRSEKLQLSKPPVFQKRQLRPLLKLDEHQIKENFNNEAQKMPVNEEKHEFIKIASNQPIQKAQNYSDEPVQIHLDDPQEQKILMKKQILAKRNLKLDLSQLPLNEDTRIQEGWNATKKVFSLFKLQESEQKQPISFTKKRINTSLLVH